MESGFQLGIFVIEAVVTGSSGWIRCCQGGLADVFLLPYRDVWAKIDDKEDKQVSHAIGKLEIGSMESKEINPSR